jgi:hypothetical protein
LRCAQQDLRAVLTGVCTRGKNKCSAPEGSFIKRG